MSSQIVPILWFGDQKEVIYEKSLLKRGEELTVLMLLLGKGVNSVRVSVNVRHAAENTSSKIIVKGVLFDNSKVDFEGLVKIDQGAKGANTWLGAYLLLLSEKATGRAVPNLEISENEVKAGHGATVGKVSEEEIFYLMSRGLPRETANNLVVQGFLEDILSQMPVAQKNKIRKQMQWSI